jgi:hypothetical protein
MYESIEIGIKYFFIVARVINSFFTVELSCDASYLKWMNPNVPFFGRM